MVFSFCPPVLGEKKFWNGFLGLGFGVSADVLGFGEVSLEVEGLGDSSLGDFLGEFFWALGDSSDLGVLSTLLFFAESVLLGEVLGETSVLSFLAGDLSKIGKACLGLDLTGLSSSLSLTILFLLGCLRNVKTRFAFSYFTGFEVFFIGFIIFAN